jgi:hypothetical protein
MVNEDQFPPHRLTGVCDGQIQDVVILPDVLIFTPATLDLIGQ